MTVRHVGRCVTLAQEVLAMPQAVWTGQLTFGLVNIPVKLYSATAPQNVRFHQFDAQTGRRIRYRRVATGPEPEQVSSPPERSLPPADEGQPEPPPRRAEGEPPSRELDIEPPSRDNRSERPSASDDEPEVPWEEIVKGFEIEPGRVVTVSPEELVSVAPERSRVLEVEQFVDLREIDPVHFDKSYYLVPQAGMGAERPYWLLYRGMEAASEVAVGRFVMRTREYLAAVRPAEHILMLETLFYADEVRDPKEVWNPPAEEPPERELQVARQLVEALAGEWEPARHRDEYRERLLDLLRSKAGRAQVLPEPEERTATPALDLMEALKASVEAAKQARADQRRRTG
ncbi:MAG: Ku protein [Actinomycetota bacterium]